MHLICSVASNEVVFLAEADTIPANTLNTKNVFYRGTSFDTGGSTAIGDSFHLDMQLSYQVNTPLSLYLRGENLTDNRQSQVIGWGMPGAAVYGGFRWEIR